MLHRMLTVGQNTNQKLERRYFEMFRRDYALPTGAVLYGDKPDVVIEGSQRVGIEITNLYVQDGSLPESEQVQSKLRQAAIEMAQADYERERGKGFELTFSFDKSRPITDKNAVARQLVELAKFLEGGKTGQVPRDWFEHIPEVDFVYLNAIRYENPVWRKVQVHEGVLMSMERLRAAVAGKDAKARQYAPCDIYWLLVIVDFFDAAQDQEIRLDDEAGNLESTVFERVLVYKPHLGHVFQAK